MHWLRSVRALVPVGCHRHGGSDNDRAAVAEKGGPPDYIAKMVTAWSPLRKALKNWLSNKKPQQPPKEMMKAAVNPIRQPMSHFLERKVLTSSATR